MRTNASHFHDKRRDDAVPRTKAAPNSVPSANQVMIDDDDGGSLSFFLLVFAIERGTTASRSV